MSTLYKLCLALAVVGALNWGLVGLFHFNLVSAIFGDMSVLSRIVYVVFGLSGLVCLGIYGLLGSTTRATEVRREDGLRRAV